MFDIDDLGDSVVSALLVLVLLLLLLAAFLVVTAVLYVVRTWAKYYPEHRTPLLIALAVCIGSFVGSALLYRLTAVDWSFALGALGIGWMLLTCLVVDLRNRETLLPEKTNLIHAVLHSPWWSEESPVETEREPVAA